uniref:Mitochondrial/bacterial CCA-adding enzyme n=1 Tax=Clandestinovirus TaxID=2831644 RepID=A0A8F8KTN6_9VIRU|nr:mitochondrial/bacterial CCA-adding enzyme [Clandestinovirus]
MATPNLTQIFTAFKKDEVNTTISPPSCRWKMFSRGILDDLDWTNVIVAGEAVVNCMTVLPNLWSMSTDIELFIHKSDGKMHMNHIVSNIAEAMEKNGKRTVNVSYCREQGKVYFLAKNYRRVVLTLAEYPTIASVVEHFDINASKVAWRPNPHAIHMTPEARQELTKRVINFNPNPKSPNYGKRLLRYAQKGFSVEMGPAYNAEQVDWTKYESITPSNFTDIHELMAAEQMTKLVVGIGNLTLIQLAETSPETETEWKNFTLSTLRLVEPKNPETPEPNSDWPISSIYLKPIEEPIDESEEGENENEDENEYDDEDENESDNDGDYDSDSEDEQVVREDQKDVVINRSTIKVTHLTESPFVAYQQVDYTNRVYKIWITLPGVNRSSISATVKYSPRTLTGVVQLAYANDTMSIINEFMDMTKQCRYTWEIDFGESDILNGQRLDVKKMFRTYDCRGVIRIEIPFYEAMEDEIEIVPIVF